MGTGEKAVGNGIYKSTDAGKTWSHIGLDDTRYITGIVVDPKDPNVVVVSVRDYFAPGPARGIFKTTDGGKTWKKVLFKDERPASSISRSHPTIRAPIYAATYKLQFDVANRRALGAESFDFQVDR